VTIILSHVVVSGTIVGLGIIIHGLDNESHKASDELRDWNYAQAPSAGYVIG